MWPRYLEILLALWLALSPLVFDLPADSTLFVLSIAGGATVGLMAVACYLPPLRRAHLVTLVLSLGFVGWAWSQSRPLSPAHQNLIATSLLLAVMAVCPTRASKPPPSWRPMASMGRPMH